MNRAVFGRFRRAGPANSPPVLSRRRFFGIAASAGGGVLGAGLWTPAHGEHDEDDDDHRIGRPCPEQDPIPHLNAGPPAGIGGFRFFFPGPVDGSYAYGPAPRYRYYGNSWSSQHNTNNFSIDSQR